MLLSRPPLVMAAVVLAACGSSNPPSTDPGAAGAPRVRVSPPAQLGFGRIAADAVARRIVRVENVGGGPLVIEALEIIGTSTDAWRLRPSVALGDPVASGGTAEIEIEYRPCPALWASGPRADPCACARRNDASILRIRTNASADPALLSLSAQAEPVGPRLALDPPAELAFGASRTATLTARNAGCGELELGRAEITGPGGAPSGSQDDFRLEGCTEWPCALDLRICNSGCETSQADLRLHYANDDAVADELAELRLASNDAYTPERIVLLTATGPTGCLPPVPVVTVTTERPCIGIPVQMHALASQSPSEEHPITGYTWSFAFVAPPVPDIELHDEGQRASFVPTRGGLHMVALTATSSCGPPGRVEQQVVVAATGCR